MGLDGGANKAERRGTPGAIRRYAVKRSSARLRRAGGEREEVPQADLVTMRRCRAAAVTSGVICRLTTRKAVKETSTHECFASSEPCAERTITAIESPPDSRTGLFITSKSQRVSETV